ncbi:MAG: S41 family peptidase [Candidatus Shapirobacteria bacterium]
MKLSRLRNFVLFASFLVIAGVAGFTFGRHDRSQSSSVANNTRNLGLFWDVWGRLSTNYLDKEALKDGQMINGAIKGMVASLGDPYTVFLSPEENKQAKEDLNGSFGGVGIQLGYNKDNQLSVIAPLTGTPADRAGVKTGDLILKIEGKITEGITLLEAVKLIRGPEGTKVKLTLLRSGINDAFEVNLERSTIVVASVELEFIDNLAHLKLIRFGDRTEEEWHQAVSQIVAQNSRGVILDLRNNPGGYLSGAVFVASEFLSSGVVVSQESRDGVKDDYQVNRQGRLTDFPLIVLINPGSASASEIVAGALQDHHRAKIVGEKSFGKGSVQEAEDFSGGAGLHITVARWLTPQGNSIAGQGITPDIEVKSSTDQSEVDLPLEQALEILSKTK